MGFEERKSFLGIEFWALWNTTLKPNYIVMKYIGYDRDTGMHYFQTLNRHAIIKKNYNQIDYGIKSNTFKPFVLPTKTMMERVK